MRDPFLDTPAGQWFVDALGLIAESDDYFALLDEARAQGTPEQCLDLRNVSRIVRQRER